MGDLQNWPSEASNARFLFFGFGCFLEQAGWSWHRASGFTSTDQPQFNTLSATTLQALMLIILADLKENQREALAQTLFQRNLSLMDATSDQITDIMTILFCAPRSSLDNPSYSHAQHTAPRTFLVIQQGECFGSSGAWCEDDETGEEGLLKTW
eukprot:260493-Amphidinium_carterae.1